MVKIKFQVKFWQSLAPGLPKNTQKVMKCSENLKPYKIIAGSLALWECHKNHILLGLFEKNTIFSEDLSSEDHVTEKTNRKVLG